MVNFSACALACLLSGADGAVLMQFTADWCGPCRTVQPTIQRLADEGYPIQRINIDRDPQTASRFGVTSIPCFVLVAGGQEVDRVVGAASYARLKQMFVSMPPSTANAAQMATNNQGIAVRGQSPDQRGFGLPRPLASLAKGMRRRDSGSDAGMTPIDIESPQTNPSDSFASAPSKPSSNFQMASLPGNSPNPAQPTRQSMPNAAGAAMSQRAMQAAMSATIRLRVEDGTGHSLGSGTIVDSHGNEALAVTCAHIFRESAGKGRIAVDVFTPNGVQTCAGTLISYDMDRDVALVAVETPVSITPVRVAPPGFRLATGMPVFSIGCDKGADPSVRESSITSIDRYVGSPNVEVAGMPVDGRSGGGLFSADGLLIGVCNAADPEDQEGIYASLPVIHWELDKIGQRRIYDQASTALANASLRSQSAPRANPEVASARNLPREMPAATQSIQATPANANTAEDLEVICIMRSRNNPQGTERLLVLDRPSRELLDRLANESHQPGSGIASHDPRSRPNPSPIFESNGPTIRAQSNDR